ncbi:MAG TPA: alpha-ketoglutarate-dependent dioxygenase AlkB, partial [Phenylobacterium sp.]|uniref:alpha-ketoglutarate-dependent dioxygenase AlkB n=1 Tax=Phenylobacterium sp. TaxID=1871053 RepID=UPI002BCCD1E7
MAKAAAQQPGLFELAPELPEGMAYRPEFVTPEEEAELAAWLAALAFEPFQFRGYEGRRQVVSFGWKYDFNRTRLEKADDLPPELAPLRARAAALAGHAPEEMQQVLINKYEPGAPIGWHRDRPVFAEVVGISLLAPCAFRMRRRTPQGFERRTITLA